MSVLRQIWSLSIKLQIYFFVFESLKLYFLARINLIFYTFRVTDIT